MLLAGRECESCNVCCVALTIDDPDLDKLQGIRCCNALPDNRCAIYERRPRTCRSFNCGWRQMDWIEQPMRPDVSGVLVWQQREDSASADIQVGGVIFMLLHEGALRAEGLAESVAAAVRANVPTYVHIPGPPGHTAAIARIDGALAAAVAGGDNTALLEILSEAWVIGAAGPFVPIVRDSSGSYVPEVTCLLSSGH